MTNYFLNNYIENMCDYRILSEWKKLYINSVDKIEYDKNFEYLLHLVGANELYQPNAMKDNIILSDKDYLFNISNKIISFYKESEFIITLPVIFCKKLKNLIGKPFIIKSGCELINYSEGNDYEYINNLCDENHAGIMIAIFANLDQSNALFGRKGLFEATKQVGELSYAIKNISIENKGKIRVIKSSKFYNTLKISKELNIDVNKEILLDIILINK